MDLDEKLKHDEKEENVYARIFGWFIDLSHQLKTRHCALN